MKTSIPRLASVRLKGGAKLHVLRNGRAEDAQKLLVSDHVEIADRMNGKLAGFAICAWGIDGSVSTSVHVRDGTVGIMMVPDFVHTALANYVNGLNI